MPGILFNTVVKPITILVAIRRLQWLLPAIL
jgi:hypothetical protein